MTSLAFTPFIEPITALFPGLSVYWLWLVIPLVVVISLVYRTTRATDLETLPRSVLIMSFQILLVMAVAAIGLNLLYMGLARWL